ncbi:MAG TPA: PSD1 and planctomycete cytochrome C domain-containing protein [Verrucomicrobiales bacterium]|nr:PSD1 and planctomycete cytochrome C domain-containing protein [Verrucomicrobiales bacterium]
MIRPLLFLTFSLPVLAAEAPLPDKPQYNRDVRPILADACFRCHGFDKNKRKADRRLDTFDGATAANEEGKKAIAPKHPELSEMLTRMVADDPDDVMPPPKETRQLSAREKEILKRWIEQGAEYQAHWAYIPPVKPVVPATAKSGAPAANAIDSFVAAHLAEAGLKPTPEADRITLVRRLYFDLTGLPPAPKDVEAVVKDTSPDAYGKLVDRLLASVPFGERMAVWWLDQARYADTIGYHSDNPAPVSPWRDYVIQSFNANKRFDRFTIEQIAGDLLPDKNQETRVASAYNRLILSTEEGGAQPKQYEAKYLTDRVKSIGTTWLGQTFMCSECHDHKYDPMTARDFYSLGAFFADIEEVAVGKRGDGIPVMTGDAAKKHGELTKRVEELERDLAAPHPELASVQAAWEKQVLEGVSKAGEWTAVKFVKLEAPKETTLEQQENASILAKSSKEGQGTYVLTTDALSGVIAGFRLEALPHDSLPAKGPGRAVNGNFVLTEFAVKIKRAGGAVEPLKFKAAHADHEQASGAEASPYKAWRAAAVIDGDAKGKQFGWAILPEAGKAHELSLALEKPVTLAQGDAVIVELLQNHESKTHGLGHFRISTTPSAEVASAAATQPPPDVLNLVRLASDKRNDGQRKQIMGYFRGVAPEFAEVRTNLASAKKEKADLEAAADRCLVTNAMTSLRTVRILPRGDWQNETGEVVLPSTPRYLGNIQESTKEKRLNRRDLAGWLISRQNPLTARVFVNRLWKLFYGAGIVKSLDDLGTQSELPEYQSLLDWLACEFMDSGWDVKHMVRLMVTSAAYRQSSKATPEALAADPQNRHLARGGRWRLDAEFVRDNALAISGLLVHTVGGPSVKPYQPRGYWENLNFPQREWDNSKDANQWRRGLYTWWQRSYVQPSLLAFDAPTREECAADRTRSNIPQQALVLLNDMTYVEAARVFATRILAEGGANDGARLAWAWREATLRDPDKTEVTALAEILGRHRAKFAIDKKAAAEAVKAGYAKPAEGVAAPELAAWMSVARVILNLSETITRS